jgi:O-antigen biosynthesis protein WbqP
MITIPTHMYSDDERQMIKRIIDIVFSLFLAMIAAIPALVIAVAVKSTSPGHAIYWSRRIGLNNSEFLMPKFRTMHMNTPQLATHLLRAPEKHLTSIGSFLRKSSLDELPQIYSIIKGDMSIVGPRPALYNQHDLIDLRTRSGVHHLKPGLTGWAQINGRDDLSIPEKVDYDIEYLERKSVIFDLKIILLTIVKAFRIGRVHH